MYLQHTPPVTKCTQQFILQDPVYDQFRTQYVTGGKNTTSEVGISDAHRMGKGTLYQGWKNIPIHFQGVCYVLFSSLQLTSFFGCQLPVGEQELVSSFAYSLNRQLYELLLHASKNRLSKKCGSKCMQLRIPFLYIALLTAGTLMVL